ncbi:hypothetical protein MTR67_016498 [Solanum verrucosum]|uniref:Uncharacterized protein n=1 Tax=Solanum verrucosum TaxID=315347 RepID=A0AAF0QHC3_SOLVR|nr:hypothetical protein MTR67_016498 [Solanum verrucosum]
MLLCPNSSAKSPDPSHFVSSLAQRAVSLHAISPSIQPIAQFLSLSVFTATDVHSSYGCSFFLFGATTSITLAMGLEMGVGEIV